MAASAQDRLRQYLVSRRAPAPATWAAPVRTLLLQLQGWLAALVAEGLVEATVADYEIAGRTTAPRLELHFVEAPLLLAQPVAPASGHCSRVDVLCGSTVLFALTRSPAGVWTSPLGEPAAITAETWAEELLAAHLAAQSVYP